MTASFERFVKSQLAAKGISLTEIAAQSGEDIRIVSHILKGRRMNRAEPVLKTVAALTGLKYGDLVRGFAHMEAA